MQLQTELQIERMQIGPQLRGLLLSGSVALGGFQWQVQNQ